MQTKLGEVIGQLRQVQAVVAVAAGALDQQNADIDADIAMVLRRNVSGPLQEQIAKLEAARTQLAPRPVRTRPGGKGAARN